MVVLLGYWNGNRACILTGKPTCHIYQAKEYQPLTASRAIETCIRLAYQTTGYLNIDQAHW